MTARPLLLLAALPFCAVAAGMMDMDADADGFVTPAEHAEGASRMFEAMDADADGRVTAAEMTAAQAKVTGKPAQAGAMSSQDKIAAVDADKDGVLTAKEHADGSVVMFGKMDADRDGRLSKAELEAGHHELQRKP